MNETEAGVSGLPHSISALDHLRVLDVSTLFAGPLAATLLGDYGADVIKVEHPGRGDPSRGHGPAKDGVGLWWKMLSRNKRPITLDLSKPKGAELMLRLAERSDVVIENFRPGTLERWGLGPNDLHRVNDQLILARVTGFGQFGPMSSLPGFGTLAEVMSGFSHITGEPDGPPTLPPFGLADGVSGLVTAFAILTALEARRKIGRGQVIDVAIIEPLLTLLGAQPTIYDQLGLVHTRTGNRSNNNAPRNTYLTADDRWVAVSTSSQSIAERLLTLVGRPDLVEQPWFATGRERAEHADELDEAVGSWIRVRDAQTVLDAIRNADAAVALVYDIEDIMKDPQYAALESIVSVDDPELGPLRMQNVPFRLASTPGRVRWSGPPRGAANSDVYGELGLDADALGELADEGVL